MALTHQPTRPPSQFHEELPSTTTTATMSISGFPYPFVTGGPAYRSKVLIPIEEMEGRNPREPDSHNSGSGVADAPIMVTAADLGAPFLRLRGISTAHLPPSDTPQEDLVPFLTALLREAVPFVDSVAPKSPNRPQPTTDPGTARSEWKPLKTKTSKVEDNGNTVVSLYERTLSAPELRAIERSAGMATSNTDDPEIWACRRSVHPDSDVPGDGSAAGASLSPASRTSTSSVKRRLRPRLWAQGCYGTTIWLACELMMSTVIGMGASQ